MRRWHTAAADESGTATVASARRRTCRTAATRRSGALTLRIEVGPRGSGAFEDVGLEAYVRDVVVGELSVGAADAALAPAAYEAQAIVARTYALAGRRRHAAEGFDLCSTTHCQVFVRNQWRRSRWASAVDSAVARTRGQYLESAGRPIEAVFHAHCGGHTSAAADVWRSAGATYLRGVDDPYCVREQDRRLDEHAGSGDLARGAEPAAADRRSEIDSTACRCCDAMPADGSSKSR